MSTRRSCHGPLDLPSTYLPDPEGEVLGDAVWFSQESPPYGGRAENNAKGSNGHNAHVNEAWREVISKWAQRAPPFFIPAERLRELAKRAEITTAKLRKR